MMHQLVWLMWEMCRKFSVIWGWSLGLKQL